jgi:hypothetical protein
MILNQWEAAGDLESPYFRALGASFISRAFDSPIFDDEELQSNFFMGNFSWLPSKTSVSLTQVMPAGFIGDMIGTTLSRTEKWALFARLVEKVAQVLFLTARGSQLSFHYTTSTSPKFICRLTPWYLST